MECAEQKGFYTSAVLSMTVSEVIVKPDRQMKRTEEGQAAGNGCNGVLDVSTERF